MKVVNTINNIDIPSTPKLKFYKIVSIKLFPQQIEILQFDYQTSTIKKWKELN